MPQLFLRAAGGYGLVLSIVRNAATIRAYIPDPHGLAFLIEGLGK